MAKKNKMKGNGLMSFAWWIVGVVVSLAVAFGLVNGVLPIPFIPSVVLVIVGWVLVVLTLLGVVMGIIGMFR